MEVVIAEAIPAATRALELDDSLGEAYAALGNIKFPHESDWIGPERESRLALERSPNNMWVHRSYSFYLISSGRSDEGIRHARIAVGLDPLTPTTSLNLGWAYMLAGRYKEALGQHDKTLELLRDEPDPLKEYRVHHQKTFDYIFSGRYEEALEECDAMRMKPLSCFASGTAMIRSISRRPTLSSGITIRPSTGWTRPTIRDTR